MAAITENAVDYGEWTDEVYLIDQDDPLEGGESGVDNRPHKNLAARTQWLRTKVAELDAAITDKIADLVDSSPGTLDTLNELAAAINDDENFAATIAARLTEIEGSLGTTNTALGNYALLNTNNVWSKAQPAANQNLALDGGTELLNMTNLSVFMCNLTEDTFINASGALVGASYIVEIVNNSTDGAKVATFSGNFNFPDGDAMLTQESGARDVVSCICTAADQLMCSTISNLS